MKIAEVDTTMVVAKALDAAVLRQQAIAQNVANANTPGYRRLSVQFENQLAAALQDGATAASIARVTPRLVLAVEPEDTTGTESDLAQLTETVLHHHALVKSLEKHLSLLGSAINGGKK